MHRRIWTLLWSAVVALGWVLAVLAAGWLGTLVSIALSSALLVGVYRVSRDLAPARSTQQHLRRGLTCAVVVVATGGWVSLIGLLATAAAGVTVLLTSPHALGLLGSLWRARDPLLDAADDSPRVGRPASDAPRAAAPVHQEPGWPIFPSAAVRCLSDAELCHSWRASYLALQRLREPGVPIRPSDGLLAEQHRLVSWRQCCLDEFERRHPQGLQRWLSSGARPAGDPSRYIHDRKASTDR